MACLQKSQALGNWCFENMFRFAQLENGICGWMCSTSSFQIQSWGPQLTPCQLTFWRPWSTLPSLGSSSSWTPCGILTWKFSNWNVILRLHWIENFYYWQCSYPATFEKLLPHIRCEDIKCNEPAKVEDLAVIPDKRCALSWVARWN